MTRLEPARATFALTRGVLPVVLAALGGCYDLPDGQELMSAHFRYHARADAVIDPGIMDRLESHRTEIDTFYGVESGPIDYYLYRDSADFAANSPCPHDRGCTNGHSVYAYFPFFEHELVHALFADAGEPAPVVGEGLAQHAACIAPEFAYDVFADQWPVDVENPDYSFGQRLVSWMLATGGPGRFVSFYGLSVPTRDAAVFALQFERFWGRRLADVAVEVQDSRFAGSSCPCVGPALPPDGSVVSFAGWEDYRTVDVAQEGRLELANGGGQLVYPYECANALVDGPNTPDNIPPTGDAFLTVAHVGAGRYGVVGGPGTVSVSQRQTAQADWSCEAAKVNPIDARSGDVTVWATADVAAGQTWIALQLEGPRTIDVLIPETDFFVCPVCPTTQGTSVGCVDFLSTALSNNYVVTPPESGVVFVSISATSVPIEVAPPTSVAIRLRKRL